MFIGRNKELNDISNYLKNGNSLMVYGLRRVGKTTLIKQALDNSNVKYIYYECIKADEAPNVRLFIDTIKDKVDFPNIMFNDFLSVFNYFNKSYKDFFLVIDEYSYLKEYYLSSKKPGSMEEAIKIDSEFKTIIDEYITNNGLILCGSSISIMKNLIEYNSPLYSRFSYVLNLKQFSYIDIKEFLPSLSNKEIIEIYSVFGGSPYVLSKINPKLSLKDNICSLLLASDAPLMNHIHLNVINEFEKDSDLNIVLNCIKNGTRKYSDIEQRTSLKNGLLDKKLKKLIDLDIIE
ncbi:MAG: AAA family ATPase [Bacilli bacterium]|nr:AAA family ATPase [Bacilli bacterium]